MQTEISHLQHYLTTASVSGLSITSSHFKRNAVVRYLSRCKKYRQVRCEAQERRRAGSEPMSNAQCCWLYLEPVGHAAPSKSPVTWIYYLQKVAIIVL
jgi:hypothetical protein